MTNDYTMEDLLDFLEHAADKGLMPSATARALAVATRNVFGVLEQKEQQNLHQLDIEAVIKRFNNKRARDFNPGSLKEYARRVRRATELYEQWKGNPSGFSVKTRTARKSGKKLLVETPSAGTSTPFMDANPESNRKGAYQSSFPVGPGRIITLSNIPEDLTAAEADRLAQFVRMLAVD